MFGSGLEERLDIPCSGGIITIVKIGVGAASASAADDVIVGRLLRRSLLFSMYDDSGSEKA